MSTSAKVIKDYNLQITGGDSEKKMTKNLGKTENKSDSTMLLKFLSLT